MNAIETITSLLGHDGLRFGEPQSAGALTIVPVFHTGPMAGYRLFGEAAAGGLEVIEGGQACQRVRIERPTKRGSWFHQE
jgi:hypothetical protein